MVDACVRASAHSINVVLPYFGYARQDRIASSREPLTAKLVANMLVKAGVSRVLTLDLHAVQVQGFFDIPVDNLYTVPLFAKHYCDKGLLGSDVVVVSPKNSGVKRARSLAEYLDAPIAIIDYAQDDSVATKERTPENVYYITASELIGDAIVRIHERKPVSPLFAYNKKK